MFCLPLVNRSTGPAWLLLVLSLCVGACTSDVPKDRVIGDWDPGAGSPDGGVDSDAEVTPGDPQALTCRPAQASELLEAREVVIDDGEDTLGQGVAPVFTSELFRKFSDHCGTCHTKGVNLGGFDVSLATFAAKVNRETLERIQSNDPEFGMPPDPFFERYSERGPEDPVRQFAEALEGWIASGSPEDLYYPSESSHDSSSDHGPYRMRRAVATTMTNLGNCIPQPEMMERGSERAVELDGRFASMAHFEDLPRRLRDTDLTTFDSEELAKLGVVAFAPAYTLWADYSKKIRHVRVPVNKTIEFDKASQRFKIPPNTRFYKTFLKKVKDLDGNTRYRKMETRLIVSRPDHIPGDGGDAVPTALFGTYKWNEDETEATLHAIPYRDGTGFTDDLFPYVADERLEAQVTASGAEDMAKALLESGARRHYAIPGADRCIHCHMGADNASFVLGFTPLQLNRRPLGEGGVIEPAAADELNQISRLVAYGIISGLDAPDQIAGLEYTQLPRRPRTGHELKAQGYMLGNCAHCHNPRGFPSVREKALASALDFLPSSTGGIFEFELTRMSPRTRRGKAQDIEIPYITPSLFDHPDALLGDYYDDGGTIGPKWVASQYEGAPDPALVAAFEEFTERQPENNPNRDQQRYKIPLGRPLLAPWRSIIYRNVDTPFSYADAGAIFPHMPMDTPGYDCRARRLLGSWMVSIPSRFVPEEGSADSVPDRAEFQSLKAQPYVEVKEDDPGYEYYKRLADERVVRFQQSERYTQCPDQEDDAPDIVAPEVDEDESRVQPREQHTAIVDDEERVVAQYLLNVPGRPHYTKADLRSEPKWVQRRSDWENVLAIDGVDTGKSGEQALRSAEAIQTVRKLRYSPAAIELALKKVPFGLWQKRPECASKLQQKPKLGSYGGADRPAWMDILLTVKPETDSNAPVYETRVGAQLFDTVCAKCHGPDANGVSALANTIADLTGGKTRVANLRDGLFGPPKDPGANILEHFKGAEGEGEAEQWAVRYLAWMGLGGTAATIPGAAISQISAASVLGEKRLSRTAVSSESAANMLSVVRDLCRTVVSPAPSWASLGTTSRGVLFDPLHGHMVRYDPYEVYSSLHGQGLIQTNGDGDLWEAVCTFDNPPPVRAIRFVVPSNPNPGETGKLRYKQVSERIGAADAPEDSQLNLISRAAYPAGAPVGDHHGATVQGITSENLSPWCVYAAAQDEEALRAYEQELGRSLPRCPDVFSIEPLLSYSLRGDYTRADLSAWATRGAANAGMLVYAYLRALSEGGEVQRPVSYDRCEELQ